jgi:hypothetical protein
MQYGLIRLYDSPGPTPVVNLAAAKLHLRVDSTDEDDMIEALVEAATLECEAACNASFAVTSYLMTLPAFPGYSPGQFGPDQDGSPFPARFGSGGRPSLHPHAILLPVHPARAVESITYIDPSGEEQTLAEADYIVVTSTSPGFIVPAAGKSWPSVGRHPEAVRVTFSAGFDAVPANITVAIKLLLGSMYEHREDIVVGATASMIPRAALHHLGPHRMWLP